MPRIVIISEDWKSRALLRAQLIEEGLDVEACETVNEAMAWLTEIAPPPSLLIADLSASENPVAETDQLSEWATQIPVWIVSSRHSVPSQSLEGKGFEVVLFRPIDLGGLVSRIKNCLAT